MAQVNTLGATCERMVANVLKEIKRAETHAIDSWINDILDPKRGYTKAHSWTRGSRKAPPLPREMWRQGKFLGQSHDIAQAMLQDWGSPWTQEQHAKGIEVWAAIKNHTKNLSTDLAPITREDLDKGA